jgi:hypothetical protein
MVEEQQLDVFMRVVFESICILATGELNSKRPNLVKKDSLVIR